MPITFDNPYNRKLAALLREMDERHNRHNGFNPEPMCPLKIGGGSSADKRFILSGNNPNYPSMYSSSGPNVIKGGDWLDDAGKVANIVAPFAPLLLGLGHKKGKKAKAAAPALKAAVVPSVEGGARKRLAKGSQEALEWGKKMRAARLAKKSGASAVTGAGRKRGKKQGGFLKEGVQKLFEIAKPVVKELGKRALNAISKKGKEFVREKASELAQKGADFLKSKTNDEGLKNVIDTVVRRGKHLATQKADDLANQGVTLAKAKLEGMGGRAKRAEIVKRIMKEKNLKMIEASKYVKLHGLY